LAAGAAMRAEKRGTRQKHSRNRASPERRCAESRSRRMPETARRDVDSARHEKQQEEKSNA
jgi:hypothetical protein